MVCERAVEGLGQQTVNNFAADRTAIDDRIDLRASFPLSILLVSRPGGSGLLTTSRFNDCELY
jgi:hypothetical protein